MGGAVVVNVEELETKEAMIVALREIGGMLYGLQEKYYRHDKHG